MTKYAPLRDFLDHQPTDRVSLDFGKVEEVLGAPLPRSAFEHQAWWANNPEGHSHCRAWHDAGWRTRNLDLPRRTVEFVKMAGAGILPFYAPPAADPWGALAGSVTIIDEHALTEPSGEIWDAEAAA